MDSGTSFNAVSGTIDALLGAGILFGFYRVVVGFRRGRKEGGK
jgi:hypothetical protein